MTDDVRSLSPSGRFVVSASQSEMKMSHWVLSPVVQEVPSGRVLATLAGTPWSLVGTEWPEADVAVLTLQRYPDGRTATDARLDCAAETARVAGRPPVPVADLREELEAALSSGMSRADLDRRRPVWVTLSDLYLDTELQPADYERMRDAVVESGYTVGEVEHILRRELGPVLGGNLLSVAGVWGAFDEEWLVGTVLRRLPVPRRSLFGGLFFRVIRSEWRTLRRLLTEARPGAGR